jgi:hypothetical protein
LPPARTPSRLALTPLPAIAALIYLTSSRGGTLVVGAAAAAVAVVVVRNRREIVDGPFTSASPGTRVTKPHCGSPSRGSRVLVYAGLTAVGPRAKVGGPLETALIAAAIIVVIVAVIAADPIQRLDEFRQLPSAQSSQSVESHLVSTSGTGRSAPCL